MSLIESKDERSLLNIVNSIFIEKRYKFQRINTIDPNTSCFTMSINYDENDIMLYELKWEVSQNSIKTISVMTNRKQMPWEVRLNDHPNLIRVVLGKLCYHPDSKSVSYEACISNLFPPFSKNDLADVHSGLYKHACKFISEISNSFVLFNSNPDLKPREIKDLASKYHFRDGISVEHTEDYEKYTSKIEEKTKSILQKTSWKLKVENLSIHEVANFCINVRNCAIPYRGKYFTMPCMIFRSPKLDEVLGNLGKKKSPNEVLNKAFENSYKLQFDTLPAIYGVFQGKITEDNKSFKIHKDEENGHWYVVAQDYIGDIHSFEESIKFLRNEKPHLAKAMIYDYFSTVCFLLPKGHCLYTDPVTYFDKEEENVSLVEKTNRQNSIMYNDNVEDIELFDPDQHNEIHLSFLPTDSYSANGCLRAVIDRLTNNAKPKLSIDAAIDSFIDQLTAARQLSYNDVKIRKVEIFKNFALFVDFLLRIYFGVGMQYIVNKTKFTNLIDSKKFCGLEFVRQICKRLCKFICLGSRIQAFDSLKEEVKQSKDSKNKSRHKDQKLNDAQNQLNEQCIQSWIELNDAFDNLTGMDILLEDLPKKMIYSQYKDEDLF